MWIKEEGEIEEEKGIMDIERGFLPLEMLRLRMYSLESWASSWVFFALSVSWSSSDETRWACIAH